VPGASDSTVWRSTRPTLSVRSVPVSPMAAMVNGTMARHNWKASARELEKPSP